MSGASFPVGRCTLLVNHHGISQPNPASWRLASSSQDLAGPCYSHHRVVHDAEAQRLMEYLYTPRYCYIAPLCFTAQRSLQVHDRRFDVTSLLPNRFDCWKALLIFGSFSRILVFKNWLRFS